MGGRRSAKRVNPVWPNGRLERPSIPARLRGKSLRSLAFRQLRAARDYIMVPYVGGQEQNSETAYAPMAIPKVKVASMMIARQVNSRQLLSLCAAMERLSTDKGLTALLT